MALAEERKMKILTISIAAYNVEKFLHYTLSSLILESCLMDMVEIIVEDDGSKDSTLEIAKAFQCQYPKSVVVNHCDNGGYGATINRSIKIATGKYFKQLDGDDWFYNSNLKDFLLFLKDADADFVITPYYNCYEGKDSILVDNYQNVGPETCDVSVINQRVHLAMHELTIRTALLKENNVSITEHCFYTDNEFTFLPLLYAKTVVRFGKPIYCYRLGLEGQSVSIEGVKKHYNDAIDVANKMFSQFVLAKKDIVNRVGELMHYKLELISDTVYTYYLVVQTNDAKKDLIAFDKLIKQNYPAIYKISDNVRKIKLLRKSNFLLYKLIGKKILQRW